MRIGSSTYSFRRLGYASPEEEHTSLLDMIPKASEYGLAGLELLAVQLESTDPAYLYRIRRLAVEHGLDLYGLSLHNNFVHPDPSEREQQVEKVKRWLDVAALLGIPVVRVFGGRWGTVRDFRELMAREGREDPLPGCRYEDAMAWNIACFRECTRYAVERGIVLALENHWGLTYSADGVLEILEGVGSDWLRVALDCGNFRINTYEQLERLVPYTILVHAKTYFGGGIFYTLDIDYERVAAMLRKSGFRGYLSIEFEGKEAPSQGIPSSVALLGAAFAAAA